MARADIINILQSQKKSPLEFQFDSLWLPPMLNYVTPQDIQALYNIASSVKYAAKIEEKYDMIDNIMTNRGFRKLGAGTNRVVYSYYEDQSFVAKIAIDRVGLGDNPAEFKNQFLLRPFVTKAFEVSQCGSIGLFERVEPITSAKEFAFMADDVFDLLTNFIIGKYVLEDIGSSYFMNWGIRKGFGPCLLDYPYVYELDGNKMHCSRPIFPDRKFPVCDGEIDYDIGFNNLVCTKCGKRYFAKDLRGDKNKIIIVKGESTMRVRLLNGKGEIICDPGKSSNFIAPRPQPREEAPKYDPNKPMARIIRPGDTIGARMEVPDPNRPNFATINDTVFTGRSKDQNLPDVIKSGMRIPLGLSEREQTPEEKVKKEQFVIYHFLEESMRDFPFEKYERADSKQRDDIQEYLAVKLNKFMSDASEKPIDKIVEDFIKVSYRFDEELPKQDQSNDTEIKSVTAPVEESTQLDENENKSGIGRFGLSDKDFEDPNYADQPQFEKIKAKKNVMDKY